jgi:hypothetical protein
MNNDNNLRYRNSQYPRYGILNYDNEIGRNHSEYNCQINNCQHFQQQRSTVNLSMRCFRCCNWGHYATECRDPPAPEHIQKSAIEQWKISRDEEQNRRNILYQNISDPPPHTEPYGQQRNKRFEYAEGSQKSKIEEIPNAETIDQKGKSVRFGKSNCIEIKSSVLKGKKFSESFNLGGMAGTPADIMAAEKRDQFKVVDTGNGPPRTRQRTRLMENNNDDNRGTSVPWPPASAQPILPDIPPRPSNIGPVSEYK